MIVLALDQSSVAIGWALGSPGSVPTIGTFIPPKAREKEDYAPFLIGSYDWLIDVIVKAGVTHVRFEQPFMPRAAIKYVKKGARSFPIAYVESNVHTLRKLYALAGIIEMVAAGLGVDVSETNIGTWRSWFLKGQPKPKGTSALKAAVMARCKEYGWKPINDNEGDALGIWAHACKSLTGDAPQRGAGELFGGVANG